MQVRFLIIRHLVSLRPFRLSFRKIISLGHVIINYSDKTISECIVLDIVQNILLSRDHYTLRNHMTVPWMNLNVRMFSADP